MKSKICFLIALIILTGCKDIASTDQKKFGNVGQDVRQETIDNTRMEVIKLNQKYNMLYQAVMSQYMQGNRNYESAAICLQELAQEIIDVNKALKIDCKQYNENGEPTLIQGEDGLSPAEGIPNVLRIEEQS